MTEPAFESACESLVREHDRDRWATARLAPPPAAGRLFALYAFNLEVARIPSVVSEPMLGEIRLQWWRDAIAEIYDGAAPRRHEVVEPLAEAVAGARLPRDLFEALLDARSYDTHGPSIGDRALFDAYVDGTAGALMRLAAGICAGGELEARDDRAARLAGWAAGAAALIRALPALYARGGDPIPTEGELERNTLAEGITPPELREALRAIAADGLEKLSQARALRPAAAIRPALLGAWRAEETLRPAARPGFEVFAQAIPSEFARRGRLARKVLFGGF
ncbi:squalene/phytoene synthase family protein [Albimonas sp. CAU 1670]|uniref:phytoene/squalene synthase family protein n=1 Tax=Albimonas sp. CAU 1670 TaxID=3032599 RepID=UPI0023D99266|nr:squalene/phytoene synthase family protein [Albimonas sp. CAU 1670]MDF2231960.1 squalene/phytoene synthase family protein [Albimonas sp. CAU 1670]